MIKVLDAILNLKTAIQASGYKSELVRIEVTKDVEQRLIYHLMQSFAVNNFPPIDQKHKLTFCGVEIGVKKGLGDEN